MTLQLFGAAIALIGAITGLLAIAQKERSDRRKEWFARYQWAIELAHSDDDATAETGRAHLAALKNSRIATRSEREFIPTYQPQRRANTRRYPTTAHRTKQTARK